MEKIKNGEIGLCHVPPRSRTKTLCLEAVRRDGDDLQFVPRSKLTYEICKAAVQQFGWALEYVPKQFLTPELYVEAVLHTGNLIEWIPDGTDLGAIRPEAEEAADWERGKDAIREHGVDMGFWHGRDWNPKASGTCGTQHCIAGWAQALSKDPKIRSMRPVDAGIRLLPRHSHLFFKTDLTKEQILEIP